MGRLTMCALLALAMLGPACGDSDVSDQPDAGLVGDDVLENPGGPDDEALGRSDDAELAEVLEAANHPTPAGQVLIVDVEGEPQGELLVVLTVRDEVPPTTFSEELESAGYRVLDQGTDPVAGVYFGAVETSVLACGVWLEVAVTDPLETHLFSRRSPAASEDECRETADSGFADLMALAEQRGFSTS